MNDNHHPLIQTVGKQMHVTERECPSARVEAQSLDPTEESFEHLPTHTIPRSIWTVNMPLDDYEETSYYPTILLEYINRDIDGGSVSHEESRTFDVRLENSDYLIHTR